MTLPIFSSNELGEWLGRDVTETKARSIERVVWGWLKGPLGLAARPDPVPDEVFSWAIELGAIAHENPAGLSSRQLGSSQRAFSLERRNEILEMARGGVPGTVTVPSPSGSFPTALDYPDPA